jgi:hypothetical protein
MTGRQVDVHAVTSDAAIAGSGVAHAETLLAFADAMVGGDDDALARVRERVLDRLGPEQLVDAAAVASNFERMVRIADATGIPLDAGLDLMTDDLRADLALARFGAAANTPRVGRARRAAGRLLRPIVFGGLRIAGRIKRLRSGGGRIGGHRPRRMAKKTEP